MFSRDERADYGYRSGENLSEVTWSQRQFYGKPIIFQNTFYRKIQGFNPCRAVGKKPVTLHTSWRLFWQKLSKTRNFKNELRHLTQLNETSKMNTITWVFQPEHMTEWLK